MRRIAPVLLAILLIPAVAVGQSDVEPGFNLFSEEQDIEIGRQSAEQVERQLPILDDRNVTRYVDRLGSRLAENAPGYDYPYRFDVVNVAELNAFALPGGFMYVNRGLLTSVSSESELAGIMAHEIAHVALRHGTSQASKAYLGDAGLSLLTGLIGGGTADDVIGAVGGFGLNSLFLDFSREDEREADIVGARILARAGYDPMSLTRVFSTLRSAAGESGSVELPTFFSSHPPYDERIEIVRAEAERIGEVALRRPIGDLGYVQAELAAMDPAADSSRYLAGDDSDGESRSDEQETEPVRDVRIEPTSADWTTFRHDRGYFLIDVPSNWQVREARSGFGVSFVPSGGMVELADGREEIVYGLLVDHFRPEDVRSYSRRWSAGFTTDEDWRRAEEAESWLRRASDDLIETLRDSNSYLEVASGSERSTRLDGNAAYLVTLTGHNPVTDRRERVTVLTRETEGDGHLIYALLIAPERQWDWMDETFDRMLDSLQVDDRAVHSQGSDS